MPASGPSQRPTVRGSPAELTVFMAGRPAARLERSGRGRVRLTYLGDYLADPHALPLSVSLPLSDRPIENAGLGHWLQSLLPDNPDVLERWYEREGVRERAPFGLLATPVGFDCAGAVQFCPQGHIERLTDRRSGLTELTRRQVEAELAVAVSDPGLSADESIEPYFSLGGYQSKIALHRIGRRWARPFGNVPTTHIFKPRSSAERLVAVSEHLCQQAAEELGIPAARTSIQKLGEITTLVVDRYDREQSDGGWLRIHQEDMCQAMGIDGGRKYEHRGGPGPAQVGDLIWRHSTQPEADVWRFADALVYAWLIINRDAHARNYSLIYRPDSIRLAPLYDMNSSLMFPRRRIGEAQMAMRYGNTFTVYSAGSDMALQNVALLLRIPAEGLIERAEQLAHDLPAAMNKTIDGLPRTVQSDTEAAERVERFARAVERRSAECVRLVSAARKRVS